MENLSLQICERSSRNEGLEQILRQMISKAVKELRVEYRAKKKQNPNFADQLRPKLLVSIQRPDDADVSPVMDQRKQLGRKIKNPVIGEKVVCFSLPEDCDVQSIKDIDKVQERLGKWRIQCRQRHSKMNDTYYCHLSSRQTFRSVPEVLSFIMCKTQQKPAGQKRKVENKLEDISSQGCLIVHGPQPQPIRKRNKVDNLISKSPQAREDKEKLEDSSQDCLIIYEPQPEASQKIHEKVANMTSDELPLEKVKEEEEKMVDISQESVENGVDSNLELSYFYMLWEMRTYDDLIFRQWEHNDDFNPLFSHANDGKDLQALLTAEPVEALSWINEVSEDRQKLQENFEPEKIETLQEAMQKLVHVQLEGVN